MTLKPAHQHNCEGCVLLGQLTVPVLGDPTKSVTWDFYYCAPGIGSIVSGQICARYGDGEAFVEAPVSRTTRSGTPTAFLTPLHALAADQTKWPLNVAAQLVIEGRPWS